MSGVSGKAPSDASLDAFRQDPARGHHVGPLCNAGEGRLGPLALGPERRKP
jgi:hypothetical protein